MTRIYELLIKRKKKKIKTRRIEKVKKGAGEKNKASGCENLAPGPLAVRQDKVFFLDVQAQLSAHDERGTSGVEKAVLEKPTELRGGDSQLGSFVGDHGSAALCGF